MQNTVTNTCPTKTVELVAVSSFPEYQAQGVSMLFGENLQTDISVFQTEYAKPPSNMLKELSQLILEILVRCFYRYVSLLLHIILKDS